jgi:hypothetical protein
MEKRADDLSEDTQEIPVPGTDEPEESESGDDSNSTEGPGNVSVDEPTDPALSPDAPDH